MYVVFFPSSSKNLRFLLMGSDLVLFETVFIYLEIFPASRNHKGNAILENNLVPACGN